MNQGKDSRTNAQVTFTWGTLPGSAETAQDQARADASSTGQSREEEARKSLPAAENTLVSSVQELESRRVHAAKAFGPRRACSVNGRCMVFSTERVR